MTNKEFIPALGYNWLSRFYDLAIRITMPEKKFRNKLIGYVNPRGSDKILEFGFGTAQNLILLRKTSLGTKIVGVDIDPKIKYIAEKKLMKHNMKIELDLYDGHRLPYPDGSFNKIFSSLVFHQLDRETKSNSLAELYRVLEPKGVLTIGDWGKPKSKLMRCLFYIVQLLDGFKTTRDNVKGILPELIEKSGFKEVSEIDYLNTKIGSYCYYQAIKY